MRIFEQLKRDHGLRQALRSENGAELMDETLIMWARTNGMAIRYIQPGKPNQNAYIVRFNRTFREEVLDPNLLASPRRRPRGAVLVDTRIQRTCLHDSLGDLTPPEHRQRFAGGSYFRSVCLTGKLPLG